MSATDRLYLGGYSQQPSAVNSRTGSLTSRSLRGINGNGIPRRTMSMTNNAPGRTNSINSQGHFQNGVYSTANNRAKTRTYNGSSAIISRTNSLSSYNNNNNNNRRAIASPNLNKASRTSSLTSTGSRARFIKTTTTTTKEQDIQGRTKSITKTIVEQRDGVKIVKTIRTVITPSEDDIQDDDDYAGFDDFSDNQEELNGIGVRFEDRGMSPLVEIEQEPDFDENEMSTNQSSQKNIALGAATAALNKVYGKRDSVLQYSAPVTPVKNIPTEKISSASSKNSVKFADTHAHFSNNTEEYVFETSDANSAHSKNYHDADTKYPESHAHFDPQPVDEKHLYNSDFESKLSRDYHSAETKFVPTHAHFDGNPATEEFTYDSYAMKPSSSANSHNYHEADTPYPEKLITEELIEGDDIDEIIVQDDSNAPDIYESQLEDAEDFEALRKKRLSEIAETTEPFDDDVSLNSDNLVDPTATLILQDDKYKKLNKASTTPSLGGESDDEFVEAKEALSETSSNYAVNDTSITRDVADDTFNQADTTVGDTQECSSLTAPNQVLHPDQSNGLPSFAKPQHSYRDLLTKSPPKNSIPRFENVTDYKNVYSSPTKDFQNENTKKTHAGNRSTQTNDSPKPLKSALKGSSLSPAASLDGRNIFSSSLQPSSSGTSTNQETKIPSRMLSLRESSNPRPSHSRASSIFSDSKNTNNNRTQSATLQDMYAAAFIAAEKKVYGDRAPVENIDEFDSSTKMNTLINSQTSTEQNVNIGPTPRTTIESGSIGLGLTEDSGTAPGSSYQSNAYGSKFRVHSLRDSQVLKESRRSRKIESHDEQSLKRLLKSDQKNEKKQWKEQRKSMVKQLSVNKLAKEQVDKSIDEMPVSPDAQFVIMQNLKQQKEEHKNYEQQQIPTVDAASSNKQEYSSPKKAKKGLFGFKVKDRKKHEKQPSISSQQSATPRHTRNGSFFGLSQKNSVHLSDSLRRPSTEVSSTPAVLSTAAEPVDMQIKTQPQEPSANLLSGQESIIEEEVSNQETSPVLLGTVDGVKDVKGEKKSKDKGKDKDNDKEKDKKTSGGMGRRFKRFFDL